MIVLSLFDGISCGRVALERAGIPVTKYYASEVDKYAISISKKNYSDIEHLGDITTLPILDNKPDIIIGGSPCQGFSFAGKQLAFNDPRSKLFFEFVKLVQFYKPRYFLLENVRMKKEYLDEISRLLGVEPVCINSSLVSAQNRVRYYWTNIPNITQPENRHIYLKDIIEYGVVDQDKSYCIDANYWKGGNLKSYFEKHRRQLVFQPIHSALTTVSKDNYVTEDYAIRKLTPIECERLQTLPDNYTQGVSNTQRYRALGNGWTVDVIAHIFKGIK